MENRNQIRFIQNIRRALGKPQDGGPSPNLFHIRPNNMKTRWTQYDDKSARRQRALLDELTLRAEAVEIQLLVVKDTAAAGKAIHHLAIEKPPEWGSEKSVIAWDHPLIKDLDLAGRLMDDQVPVTTTGLIEDTPDERARLRKAVEAAYIGVTSADFVVAHTATMVMKSTPGQFRSVSLVPSIHVCVVTVDKLLTDLEELYTRLQWDPRQQDQGLTNCMTFISAPSKTGDIELVMVNGAHGPREVHLIVIAG